MNEAQPQPGAALLPPAPASLTFGAVTLRFGGTLPGDAAQGIVPSYHFRIQDSTGADVGHLNFRVGDTAHVRLAAGHIGFSVAAPFQGQGYARQACQAVAPFVRQFYQRIIITCDPDNLASRRTIERLGAEFIEESAVPPGDPHYERGARLKRRYYWVP